MAAPRASPKASSAPSSSSGLGKYFRRASPPNRSVEPRADQKKVPSSPSQQPESERRMQRSAVFGSCAQSVGTVASVLFAVINRSGHYDESARDSTVTRQAKILVQKERGEWQGFSSPSSSDPNNNGPEDTEVSSPRDLLTSRIDANSIADQLGVLNELLEVSFRNLMGPLVPLELYTRHKKVLLRESLAVPPALTTLLAIRGVLDHLEREVRHCLLRLLALWDLIALVSGEVQPLLKTIADKHHHVFSESSEFESMTARKSERQDTVAIDLLQIMVLYRDILFSDIEINSRLIEDAQIRAWPPESEPAALSEEEGDRFSSDGDVSSSISSDENQVLHDDLAAGMEWGQGAALGSLALRSRASSSSVTSVQEHQDGESYNDKDEEDKLKAAAATPSFLSLAASSLAIPVAAATLCVIATMATLAIYEMRRAPRH
uniref:Uncharacterized protein n=1 Tax=Phytophthora ramorum TaxID=164328 RepID=H3HCS1_PHYRM